MLKAVFKQENAMNTAEMSGEMKGGECNTGTAKMRCGAGNPPSQDWMGLQLD